MNIIIASLTAAIMAGTICLEFKRDLMMFQQNSYRLERYRHWLADSADTTSPWRLGALVIFFISLSSLSHPLAALVLTALFGIAAIWNLATAKYKKPLVWTPRARRIYSVTLLLTAAITVAVEFIFPHAAAEGVIYTAAISLLGCYCGSHLLLAGAACILSPVEKAINRRYCRDAERILASMPDLKIIGITGSYGKTSTKHYLYRILCEQFDTLMTPGSYNTTLGVVRTVREMLKPYNEVFIVEMGAKSPGDIKEICDIVHPTMGIITAVGPQHLESFKTIDAVQATKFELADALPTDGLIIVNDDFEKIASRSVYNTACARYAVTSDSKEAKFRATDVKYTSQGTTFTVVGPEGWTLPLSTRLMGECNVSDLLAAVVAAHSLGVPDHKIASAVASIEPVEHRLSVKTTPGGLTILDDAFNSNPVGSRMALEVLGSFKGGKRIVITPGMIELGTEQEELNRQFGGHIARNADVAIIVGHYNRDAISQGIKEAAVLPEKDVHLVDTFAEAQALLTGMAASGDTVLYENDLPDTFK